MSTQTERIVWRRQVMAVGGTEYLRRFFVLFGCRERCIAPDFLGLPPALEAARHRHAVENPVEIAEFEGGA